MVGLEEEMRLEVVVELELVVVEVVRSFLKFPKRGGQVILELIT